MMRSPAYRDIEVVQLGVGEEKAINASGMRLTILSASEPFELSFGDDAFFYAEAGLGFRPIFEGGAEQTFRTLRVRNTGVNPLDVRMQVGTGETIDNRAVFGGSSVPVAPAAAAVFDVKQVRVATVTKWSATVAAGGWPTVKPAAANRRALWIANRGTETVFVSSNGGPSNEGIPLPPGDRIRLETAGDIEIYNPSAVSVQVTGVEELF